MCFAPHKRALFRHVNFQKCSKPVSSLHFWLGNVLRATTACTFSTSQLPKVVLRWCALYILTWNVLRATTACSVSTSQLLSGSSMVCFVHLTSKRASCHKACNFFISYLAWWLRTRRFSTPTFWPSGATSHQKNKVFREFSTFSRTCIFFLSNFSSLIFLLLFSSLTLPICFSFVDIVGGLISKLPSNIPCTLLVFWINFIPMVGTSPTPKNVF